MWEEDSWIVEHLGSDRLNSVKQQIDDCGKVDRLDLYNFWTWIEKAMEKRAAIQKTLIFVKRVINISWNLVCWSIIKKQPAFQGHFHDFPEFTAGLHEKVKGDKYCWRTEWKWLKGAALTAFLCDFWSTVINLIGKINMSQDNKCKIKQNRVVDYLNSKWSWTYITGDCGST